VAKRCTVEQKADSLGMNYLDLCSEVVSRSHEPLCYIQRWISQKLLEIETRFQKTTDRKLPTGIKWSRDNDVTWPWKVKLVTPIRLERNISKTAGDRFHSNGLPIANGLWHWIADCGWFYVPTNTV